VKRFITLSAFGLLYHGPSGHYFYNWLDDKIPGKDGLSVAKKIIIDQTLWCPLFMTVFFTYLGLPRSRLIFLLHVKDPGRSGLLSTLSTLSSSPTSTDYYSSTEFKLHSICSFPSSDRNKCVNFIYYYSTVRSIDAGCGVNV
jgi:hypothetical protein